MFWEEMERLYDENEFALLIVGCYGSDAGIFASKFFCISSLKIRRLLFCSSKRML